MVHTEILSGRPDDDPAVTRHKKILRVGTAALLVATGGTIYFYNRSQKFPTPQEERARAGIHDVFASMAAEDVVTCTMMGPSIAKTVELPFVGPKIGKRGHVPAISVDVSVQHGAAGEGAQVETTAGRYHATITWQSLHLEGRIHSLPSPHPHIPSSYKHLSAHQFSISSTFNDDIFPSERTENIHVVIPLQSQPNATAHIDIVPVVDHVKLTESTQGYLEIIPITADRELVGKPCVSMNARIQGSDIREVEVFQHR